MGDHGRLGVPVIGKTTHYINESVHNPGLGAGEWGIKFSTAVPSDTHG